MPDVDPSRARTFGRVAAAYDRYRPTYPGALIDDLLAGYAIRDVLESGAGTGRATRLLADRGVAVTAVEPDPEMAAVLRATVPEARVIVAGFEDADLEPAAYDLVAAAQSWHWVDPARGAAQAHRALRPGGRLACWWNYPDGNRGPAWDAVDAAYAAHAPELARRPGMPDRRDNLPDQPAGFAPWTIATYAHRSVYSAGDYANLVATSSDHIALDAARRDGLLAAIVAAVDANGGRLDYAWGTDLVVAVRDTEPQP